MNVWLIKNSQLSPYSKINVIRRGYSALGSNDKVQILCVTNVTNVRNVRCNTKNSFKTFQNLEKRTNHQVSVRRGADENQLVLEEWLMKLHKKSVLQISFKNVPSVELSPYSRIKIIYVYKVIENSYPKIKGMASFLRFAEYFLLSKSKKKITANSYKIMCSFKLHSWFHFINNYPSVWKVCYVTLRRIINWTTENNGKLDW